MNQQFCADIFWSGWYKIVYGPAGILGFGNSPGFCFPARLGSQGAARDNIL